MIKKYRNKLDEIDDQIVTLLADRFRVTEQIGKYKAEHMLPAKDSVREKQKLDIIGECAKRNNLEPTTAKLIFKTIMELVIKNHKKLQIQSNEK